MYEVKKIDDVGVFIITSLFSIFAYVWMYICLLVTTPGYVTTAEAWITLIFFFLLLAMAFGADKYRQRSKERMKTEADAKEEREKEQKAV